MRPAPRVSALRSFTPLLVVLACLAGCAAGPEVHTETRPNSVLATARTYTLQPPDDFTEQKVLQDVDLRSRIDALIRAQLAARGLREVEKGASADLLVRYVLSSSSETLSAPPIGQPSSTFVGLVRAPVVGEDNLSHDVNSRNLREAVMAVDVLAPQSREILWRATITQVLGSGRDKNLDHAQGALERAFRDLPVGSR
jgi:hypothetical protein